MNSFVKVATPYLGKYERKDLSIIKEFKSICKQAENVLNNIVTQEYKPMACAHYTR